MRVAVLLGGRSGEHEVSVRSGASVLGALAAGGLETVPVGISRAGEWLLIRDLEEVVTAGQVRAEHGVPVVLAGAAGRGRLLPLGALRGDPSGGGGRETEVDAVFPVLHGPYGEDGTVQGLLEMAGVPYVGSGVLASALGMDKGFAKDIWRLRGLPVVEYLVVRRSRWRRDPGGVRAEVEERLGYPCFVKPANLGSSVGISKVAGPDALADALDRAGDYDTRLVVERAVDARELEVSVLGNEEPLASVPGEIVPSREFYDYEAKYLDDRSRLLIPAPVDEAVAAELRRLAVEAYLALDCTGFARVDFFLERGTGRLYVNEINTIPGFTSISMYPKLWEATGLPYPDLVRRLLDLALERWRERRALRLTP